MFENYPIFLPNFFIPNLQLNMPNWAFYPQLGILSVSSLIEFINEIPCLPLAGFSLGPAPGQAESWY